MLVITVRLHENFVVETDQGTLVLHISEVTRDGRKFKISLDGDRQTFRILRKELLDAQKKAAPSGPETEGV